MSLIDRLLGRRQCRQLIKYQGRTLEFGFSLGKIFSLNNLNISEQKFERASRIAMALDTFQVRYCYLYRHLKEDDPRFDRYLQKQENVLLALTRLEATLLAFETDPNGERES
jgi:hypothetical protein